MRVKRIIYDGSGVLVDETRYVVIRESHYLVKPLHVFVGFIENILLQGYRPLLKPLVLGSSGVARVLESSYGSDPGLTGKIVIISPIGERGILSWDADGVLSTYASIHRSYIMKTVARDRPEYAYYPFVAHGCSLGEVAGDNTLIVGCDIVGVSAAMYLSLKKYGYGLYCGGERVGNRIGLNIYRNLGEIQENYDSIIITDHRASLAYSVLRRVTTKRIIYSAFTDHSLIFSMSSTLITMKMNNTMIKHLDENDAKTIMKKLRRHIVFVNSDDLGKIKELIPTRGLGVVVSLRSRS